VVAEVVRGGPADEAGLRARDVITKFAGKDVRLPEQVVEAVSSRKPGDEVEVEVARGDRTRTVTVELARRPRQVQRQG
jgi:S1-C subfamily serine protease